LDGLGVTLSALADDETTNSAPTREEAPPPPVFPVAMTRRKRMEDVRKIQAGCLCLDAMFLTTIVAG